MPTRRRSSRMLLAVVLLVSTVGPFEVGATEPVEIRVLSSRADLISGGDALVEIDLPAGTDPSAVTVDLDGVDVTSAFAVRSDGSFKGLVTGLGDGTHTLTATLPDDTGARITITAQSHVGGPVLSGPQIQPWTCLPGAVGPKCLKEPVFTYRYKPANGGAFAAYDPANPPAASQIATTTTDEGITVPFIVRQETGSIDRDEYRIAVLWRFDGSGRTPLPWSPTEPQDQWNQKVVITHGASCDTGYAAAAAPDVMNETALARGFAVMSNALDNAGHNCNIVTQAESLVMTKERLIDTLGKVRYAIGTGCSGGALVQYQVANAFPGLYQGILPQCSYPDAWSSAMQYIDYDLILQYLRAPQKWGTGVAWDPASIGAVLGHPNVSNPITFTTVIPNSGKPNRSCPGLSAAQVWSPSNPNGVRCTLYDYMVNVFGRQGPNGPNPTWAASPWDNTGVQYGLKALLANKLTADQFLDINAKLGGLNDEGVYVPERNVGTPFALAAAYRSGAITQANNLDEVAIIDLRGPDPGAFHDVYRTYALRARLEREHGTAANQALWRGFVPLLGDANFVSQGIIAIDAWLAKVEADTRDVPLSQKIIEHRNVADRCTNGAGVELPAAACDATVTSYTTPRIEAGMPFTDDVMKCQLKPLRRSDYYPVFFTDAQWARMQVIFPNGVCDYSKPGQYQQDTVGWQTYQDAQQDVIYGGTAMGPAPVSQPF